MLNNKIKDGIETIKPIINAKIRIGPQAGHRGGPTIREEMIGSRAKIIIDRRQPLFLFLLSAFAVFITKAPKPINPSPNSNIIKEDSTKWNHAPLRVPPIPRKNLKPIERGCQTPKLCNILGKKKLIPIQSKKIPINNSTVTIIPFIILFIFELIFP
jgi:hypothetical protein